jgi:hypothetical protein
MYSRNHLEKHGAEVDPDAALRYANSTCILCMYGGNEGHIHPADVVPLQPPSRQAIPTRNLCMYCDVEWNHPYQYQDHLEKYHPDVDPDLILRRATFTRNSCMYCDYKWKYSYRYKNHLERRHSDVDPDVALRQANSARNLCMYCDVEWNHPYEYKGHLREHHPNLDPDAVLGEVPGSHRRDKIIARLYKVPGERKRRGTRVENGDARRSGMTVRTQGKRKRRR